MTAPMTDAPRSGRSPGSTQADKWRAIAGLEPYTFTHEGDECRVLAALLMAAMCEVRPPCLT